ncbi:MAG: hypothetical protein ACKVP4_09595 [Hyphomicrobium sp.]
MKYAVLATIIAAVALGACRRETPYDNYGSMKLGVPAEDAGARR